MTPDTSFALHDRTDFDPGLARERRRAVLFAILLLVSVSLSAAIGSRLGTRTTPTALAVGHASLFLACIAVWLAGMQASLRRTGLLILLTAAAMRLALLPFPASDDVSRYLWEGGLVASGASPYAAPAADAPEVLRDALWAGVNNKSMRAVYPPGAEIVFAVVSSLPLQPLPMKLLFTAAEMTGLALLLAELRRRRLPEANLALAALAPVPLLATAAEGHYDAVFVLAMLLALLAFARRRSTYGWLALAVAIELKLVAVLLVPLLLRRCGWRNAWILPLGILLPALPFLGDLPDLAQGLLAFGGTTWHDGCLPAVLRWAGLSGPGAAGTSFAILVAWTVLVAVRVDDVWRGAFMTVGALLLLSPIVHFWYFAWIVPFLVLQPQPAWLLAVGMQAFYFTAWAHAQATGRWLQPGWAWWPQWLPMLLVLAVGSWPAARRLFAFRGPFEHAWPAPRTVSAIVPTYGEADGILACLAALRRQGPALLETIVVDGGSPDATRTLALGAGARVLVASRGRGMQIAAGVRAARGDVVWVVHADVVPVPGTAEAVLAALAADPAACGGAVGARFARPRPLELLIEAMNAARSALFGLSFGDQGQFVRRAALPSLGGFPPLPLMEDLALSLRLRHAGPVLHLGCHAVASSRRWRRSGALARIATVVGFTARFLVSRRRAPLAQALFHRYYPPAERDHPGRDELISARATSPGIVVAKGLRAPRIGGPRTPPPSRRPRE